MISDTIYYHYFNSLMDGDKVECVKIIADLLEKNEDVKEIYTKVFQKSMYRIGYLWEQNRTSVANEHRATKITESLLNLVYPKIIEKEKSDKKVVITCVDKEFHEIGPRIVSDFFELNGWNSVFLGANTPQNEILETIRTEKPDVVGVSSSFYINIARLLKLIDLIKIDFPEQEVIVGGQALENETAEILQQYNKVYYIPTLTDVEEYILNYSK